MKKKVLSILISTALMASLTVGCGSGSVDSSVTTQESDVVKSEESLSLSETSEETSSSSVAEESDPSSDVEEESTSTDAETEDITDDTGEKYAVKEKDRSGDSDYLFSRWIELGTSDMFGIDATDNGQCVSLNAYLYTAGGSEGDIDESIAPSIAATLFSFMYVIENDFDHSKQSEDFYVYFDVDTWNSEGIELMASLDDDGYQGIQITGTNLDGEDTPEGEVPDWITAVDQVTDLTDGSEAAEILVACSKCLLDSIQSDSTLSAYIKDDATYLTKVGS